MMALPRYLNSMYTPIDIYEPESYFTVEPVAKPISGPCAYVHRFYLRDTVEVDGIKLVQLTFAPRNPNDLLFRGTMYITLDGNYAVQKIQMGLTKHAESRTGQGSYGLSRISSVGPMAGTM